MSKIKRLARSIGQMKVLVNCLPIMQESGVATYTTRLFDELLQETEDIEYILVCSENNADLFAGYADSDVRVVVLPTKTSNSLVRVILEQVLIPLLILYWRVDLLFAPRNIVPALTSVPSVVVMHSMHLNYAYGIDDISLLQRAYGAIFLQLSALRATRVIAISKTIKKTAAEHLPITTADIDVVYHGAGIDTPDISKESETDNDERNGEYDSLLSQRSQSNIRINEVTTPYVLFVGQLAWHKNAHKLIKAFAKFKDKYGTNHNLIIAGKDINNNSTQLSSLSEQLGIYQDVQILGRVPQETINPLYQHADVFVYPSAIEGFGLPPLEAMANGTPVIGSNRTSVPEVIADAGVIIDPDDTDEFSEAIARVVMDDGIRSQLVKRGFDRVDDFSWERTAAQSKRILKEFV